VTAEKGEAVMNTRISLVFSLVVNAWTLYLATYYGLWFLGATTVAGPMAFLAGLAAVMEPLLTLIVTGRI